MFTLYRSETPVAPDRRALRCVSIASSFGLPACCRSDIASLVAACSAVVLPLTAGEIATVNGGRTISATPASKSAGA